MDGRHLLITLCSSVFQIHESLKREVSIPLLSLPNRNLWFIRKVKLHIGQFFFLSPPQPPSCLFKSNRPSLCFEVHGHWSNSQGGHLGQLYWSIWDICYLKVVLISISLCKDRGKTCIYPEDFCMYWLGFHILRSSSLHPHFNKLQIEFSIMRFYKSICRKRGKSFCSRK